MAGVQVRLNSAGFKAVMTSDGVRAELEGRTRNALNSARGSAPVVTGNYISRLEAQVEQHGDRLVGRVYARAPHSHFVEAKHGVLARAVDQFGGA